MSLTPEDRIRSTEAAWDRVAEKYRSSVESDIQFLRDGGISLMPQEVKMLGDLSQCRTAIHLLCSHGLDTLSLLNLGVQSVIGVDLSREMLSLAAYKSEHLGASAEWVHASVLELPPELDGVADLVITGKGALPWIADLDQWARNASRLLRSGGCLFAYEGHPLNWVWANDAHSHQLSADGRGYFDREPRANDDFPARAVESRTILGEVVPLAWEYQWTLGAVITALSDAGFRIERLEEHPEQFWQKFRSIPDTEMQRVPHTFGVLARWPVETPGPPAESIRTAAK